MERRFAGFTAKDSRSQEEHHVMGSRFLAPCTELICSGSVSDLITMSEPLDQGAKG